MAGLGVEQTTFTLDVLGRFSCNTDSEALAATQRADARPFDVIVLGGGSFGPILAENVFFDDVTHSRRVLVLDAGPMVLPEHVQNLPVLGNVESLVTQLPWRADERLAFAGLRVMLGGRSVFFGGWSPQPLDDNRRTEMPRTRWPAGVVQELKDTYFPAAAAQLAVDDTNDFIWGELHEVLRQRLAAGIDGGKVPDAIPLDELQLRVNVPPGTSAAERRLLRLEAPLAVQSKAPRPGFFPFNKFSAVPLIVRCAREAQSEVASLLDDRAELGESEREGDDVKKRYMVVPNMRVTNLEATPAADGPIRVTRIHCLRTNRDGNTSDVQFEVADGANVVVALGTIESARLLLNSFPDLPARDLVGANLMAHLRSNVVMRIPRASLPPDLPRELRASALFCKGQHDFDDGTVGFFHLQITAAGLDNLTDDDHVELFMKVPDIDFFDDLAQADDEHVVITIRGIGEMQPSNPLSKVSPTADSAVRAEMALTAKDEQLWAAMDAASDEVARVFAGGNDFEIRLPDGRRWKTVAPDADLTAHLPLTFRNQGRFPGEAGPPGRRDRLGTTHHEAGTIRLGSDPVDSPADEDARVRDTANVYLAGPMLFPTVGSPNPMLTGTALARRLATHLLSTMPVHEPTPAAGFTSMFNGRTLDGWRMSTIHEEPGRSNPGRFIVVDGALEATPGTGLGLLWHTRPMPANYVLTLQWKRFVDEANSGVLLRFPNPDGKGYRNTAYVADHFGYEVQIDELGAEPKLRTGAIYNVQGQKLTPQPAKPAGEWNDYEIQVQDNTFTVRLNGKQVTRFVNTDPNRGQPVDPHFVGLQIHFASRMAFRDIQFRAL